MEDCVVSILAPHFSNCVTRRVITRVTECQEGHPGLHTWCNADVKGLQAWMVRIEQDQNHTPSTYCIAGPHLLLGHSPGGSHRLVRAGGLSRSNK